MKYAAIFLLMMIGCCPEPVMQVQIDTLRIYQPETNDTLLLIQNDTVWTAGNDRYFVRVDTLLKKIYIKEKADTMKVPYPDSVFVYRNKDEEKSFFDGLTLKQILIWITCLGVIGFLYRMFTGK